MADKKAREPEHKDRDQSQPQEGAPRPPDGQAPQQPDEETLDQAVVLGADQYDQSAIERSAPESSGEQPPEEDLDPSLALDRDQYDQNAIRRDGIQRPGESEPEDALGRTAALNRDQYSQSDINQPSGETASTMARRNEPTTRSRGNQKPDAETAFTRMPTVDRTEESVLIVQEPSVRVLIGDRGGPAPVRRVEGKEPPAEEASTPEPATRVNQAPVANADRSEGRADSRFEIDVLANDTDGNADDAPATFTLDQVQIVGNTGPAGSGQVAIVNNRLVFTPGSDFDALAQGETATVTVRYQMSDGEGASASSTATVIVTGVNAAPDAVDDTLLVQEGGIHTFTVADFGFRDIDTSDTLQSVTITRLPAEGSLTLNSVAVTTGQVITAEELDTLTFMPENHAHGDGYSDLQFTVSDGRADSPVRTLTIDVGEVNDAPTAQDQTLSINEDGSHTFVAGDFGFADVDTGDALHSVTITRLPLAGILTLRDTPVTLNEVITAANIGNLKYAPEAHASGNSYADLQFTVSDGELSSSAQTVTFNVTPLTDAPSITLNNSGSNDFLLDTELITNGSVNGADGWDFSGNVLVNNGLMQFSSGNSPVTGVVEQSFEIYQDVNYALNLDYRSWNTNLVSARVEIVDSASGTILASQDVSSNTSSLQALNLDFTGIATGSALLRITDTTPNTAGTDLAIDNVSIQAPSADNDGMPALVSGQEDQAIAVDLNVATPDSDGSETLAIEISGIPSGVVLSDGTNTLTSTGAAIDASGWNLDSLTLTPAANNHDDFTFSLKATATETATGATNITNEAITVHIEAVNDAPTAQDKTLSISENGSHTFAAADFGFDDADTGDTLQSVTITRLPSVGSLTLNDTPVTLNQIITASDIGTLKYAPAAHASGDSYADLQFTVSDGGLSSSAQTVTFNVSPVTDAPTVELNNDVYGDLSLDTNLISNGQFATDSDWTLSGSVGISSSRQSLGFSGGESPVTGVAEQTFAIHPDINYSLSLGFASANTNPVSGRIEIIDVDSGTVLASQNVNTSSPTYQTLNLDFTGIAAGNAMIRITDTTAITNSRDLYVDNVSIQAESADNPNHNPQVNGTEDQPVVVNLSAATPDSDGSETLAIALSGIPSGVELSDGTNTLMSTGAAIDVSDWDLGSLTLTPPANNHDDFTFTVQATATETATGTTNVTNQAINVHIEAVNDPPVIAEGETVDSSAAFVFSEGSGTTVVDQSGNDNAMTLSGTATWGTGHDGTGNALEMDGSSSAAINGLETGGAMTVAAWVEFDSTGGWSRIIDFGDGVALNNIVLGSHIENGLGVHIFNGAGQLVGQLRVEDVITANQWTHVAFTVDDTGQITLYVDGASVGTATMTTGAPPEVLVRSNNLVGADNWNANQRLDGRLDDLLIANESLDANEISNLYRTSQLSDFTDAHFSLDENSANGTVVGQVSATDAEDGTSLTYALADNAGGRFAINSSSGEITVADGSLLDHDVAGSHTLRVRVTDSSGLSSERDFVVQVADVREAPTAQDKTLTITEDGSHTFAATDFGFSDGDSGDTLQSVTITQLPSAGSLTLDDSPVTANQVITAADITQLKFTPDANANGTGYADLAFTVSDGSLSSAAQTLTFDVTAVNDPPVIAEGDIVDTSAAFVFSEGTGTTVADQSGNNNAMTLSGTATWGTGHDGTGNALEMDASSSAAINGLETGGAMTVAAWVEFDATGNWSRVIDFGDGAGVNNIVLGSHVENGLGVHIFNGAGQLVGQLRVEDVITANQWTHVAFTVDDAGQITLYVDGASVGTATMTTGAPPEVLVRSNNLVGADNWNANQRLDGRLDDLVVVNESLDANQISNLYKASELADFTDAHFTLNENSANGTVVGQVSGSDTEDGTNVTYALADDAGGRFAINSTTGEITVADSSLLDHETDGSHTLRVRVTDSGGLSSERDFVVQVADVNDAPEVADQTLTVAEDSAYQFTASDFSITDQDTDDTHTLTIEAINGGTLYKEPRPDLEFQFEEATGTTTDDDRNNVQGTLTGVTWATDAERGGIVTFDQNSDQINLAQAHNLGSEWTITTEFRNLRSDGGGNWQSLVSSNSNSDVQVLINTTTGEIGTWEGGVGFHGTGANVTDLGDTWHSLTVIGQDGKTHFYMDGEFLGTADYQSTGSIEVIGNNGFADNQAFAENLNNFRIYNTAQLADLDVPTVQGSDTPILNLDFEDSANLANDQDNSITGIGTSVTQVNDPEQGNVLQFDASSDRIVLDQPLEIGNEWTITTRFKNLYLGNGSIGALARSGSGDLDIHIEVSDAGILSTRDRGSNTVHSSGFDMSTLSDDWHTLTAVGSGGKTYFYIDNVHVGTSDYQSTEAISSIGSGTTYDYSFAEFIDDFQVYDTAYFGDQGQVLPQATEVNAGDTVAAEDASDLRFIPDQNTSGDGVASIDFKATDNHGADSTTETLTFNVTPVNDAPTATDNTLSVAEDESHTFAASEFGFTDIDTSDSLQSVTITRLPASGGLTLSGVAVTANQVIAVADIPNLQFAPENNDNGIGYADVAFTVSDGSLSSAEQTITFDVTPVNDAPTAADNTLTINEDTAYQFDADDFSIADPDVGDTHSVTITAINGDGTLYREPAPDLSLNFSDQNDPVNDAGNNIQGSMSAGVEWQDDHEQGGVLRFDSANDALTLDTALTVSSEWTLSVRFRNPDPVDDNQVSLLTRADGFGDGHVAINSNGELGVFQRFPEAGHSGDTVTLGGGDGAFFGSGYFVTGLSADWHSLMAVGEAGQTTFYINGEQVGTSDFQAQANISTIGGNNSVFDPFAEFIDDFEFYNGVTLDETTGVLEGSTVVNAGDSVTTAELSQLTFVPDDNVNGANTASIEFKAVDNHGAESSVHTLTFDVTAINDAPLLSTTLDTAVSAEFMVNTETDSSQKEAVLTPMADGGYLAVWHSEENGGHAIKAQKYAYVDETRSITIADHSFESVALSDGANQGNPAASAWTFTGSIVGIHDYAANHLTAEASDGENVGYINDDGGMISQTLSETFDRSSNYTLHVDIGNRQDMAGMNDYTVRLSAGGVVLVSDGSVIPNEGEFATLTLELNGVSLPANSPAIGQPLTIELVNNSGPQVAFDNVRLTATTPELQPDGAEYQVDTATLVDDERIETPQVASLDNGNYAVVWRHIDPGVSSETRMRIFSSDGTEIQSEFSVDTAAGHHYTPDLISLSDNRFLVAHTNNATSINAVILDAEGNTLQTTTTGTLGGWTTPSWAGPEATALDNGGFALTWRVQGTADNNTRIQFFDSDGNNTTGEISFGGTSATGDRNLEIDTLENGQVVTVYKSGDNLFFQCWSDTGSQEGSAVQINTSVSPDISGLGDVTIEALSDGGFFVVWRSTSQDQGGSHGVYGRRFDADGNPLTGEIAINSTSADNQFDPSVVQLESGALQVLWTSNQDGNDNIYSASVGLGGNQVNENAAHGTLVGRASATDVDDGDTLTYELVNDAGGRFAIDASTGDITVADGSRLDHETDASHTIRVRVTDSGGLTAEQDMVIQVQDVNEAPDVSDTVTVTAPENLDAHTVTEAFLLSNASDQDGDTLSVQDVSINGVTAHRHDFQTSFSAGTGGSVAINGNTLTLTSGAEENVVLIDTTGGGTRGTDLHLDFTAAPTDGNATRNNFIVFDYVDANNYKAIGSYDGSGKPHWVVEQWTNGTLTRLSSFNETSGNSNINTDRHYEVDIVDNRVSLTVDGVEKIAHQFSENISDGELGVMNRGNSVSTYTLNGADWDIYPDNQHAVYDNNDGTWAILPGDDLAGDLTLDYTVSDGELTTAATAVIPIDRSPDASIELSDTTGISDDVLPVETTADGDPLTVTSVNGQTVAATGTTSIDGEFGTLDITASGSWTYNLDAAYASADLTSDLIAHWTFDGNANDSAPSDSIADNGVLTGDAAYTSDAVSGSALTLDGTGDRVNIATTSELGNYTGTTVGQRTISLFFKPDATNSLDGKQVLYEEGGSSHGFAIYLDGGKIYVGGWANSVTSYVNTDISYLDSSNWHHIALVMDDAGNSLTGYLDGESFGNGNGIQVPAHSGSVAFGGPSEGSEASDFHDTDNGVGTHFHGQIDEGRVYNRSLTEAEIKVMGQLDQSETFTYDVSDGTHTSTATLAIDVQHTLDSTDGISGTVGDETLTGTAFGERIEGLAGMDTLIGNDGDDFLVGGIGNDTMTGGTGSDTFVWIAGHEGTASAVTIDTITDFNATPGGDAIDLSLLLSGETEATLDQYLNVNVTGGNTEIDVTPAGAGGDVTQKIILQGVDLSGLGDNTAILNTLLQNGNLHIDG